MVVVPQESVRYAITDVSEREPGTGRLAAARRLRALEQDLARWSRQGITYVQLREKRLSAGEVLTLAVHGMALLRAAATPARPLLLVNGRADIAAAAAADGVHLTGHPGELLQQQVQAVFAAAGLPRCTVSQSCHTPEEARTAHLAGVSLILFGPVREKRVAGRLVTPGQGFEALGQACATAAPTPVLALGGLTLQDEPACRAVGAAGLAGLRLFAPA